jgi:hypothetical protein
MRHEVWRDGGGFLVVGSVGRVHHRRPVYLHDKFLHAVNALAADYNVRG